MALVRRTHNRRNRQTPEASGRPRASRREVLVNNLWRFLDGQELDASFHGHTNCFIEAGFHQAMLIDFN